MEREGENILFLHNKLHGSKKNPGNAVLNALEKWFVYILRCADGTLYTGITKDIKRRLEQHNAGTASRFTRCRLPVRLEYQEVQSGQGAALKREVVIKKLTRRAKEALFQ